MFRAAQKIIGGRQCVYRRSCHDLAHRQQLQHRQRRLYLQGHVPPATDQLEHLGQEFNLADAAGAELDVIGHILFGHFATNLRMQLAHRIDRAKIQVFTEHKGTADGFQSVVMAPGQRPRLDPGITLPFAPLSDEIVLQHVERTYQRPRIAIRPQAHVHAEHLPVGSDFGNRIDQAAPQPREKLEVGDAALIGIGGIRITIVGIDEDQINV